MLTLHFDLTSPSSAVAVLRLQRLADEGGAVRFAGIDILGLDSSIPPTLDLLADLERHQDAARELGLTMRRPSRQPPTVSAHLVGEVAEEIGLGASWRSACLRAYWTRDADLHDDPTLLTLAELAGLPADVVAQRLADRTARANLRTRMLAQRRRGIGGVPVLESDGVFVTAALPDDDLRRLAGR